MGHVVRGDRDTYEVSGEDTDVVLFHLAPQASSNLGPVFSTHPGLDLVLTPTHCIQHHTFQLNQVFSGQTTNPPFDLVRLGYK